MQLKNLACLAAFFWLSACQKDKAVSAAANIKQGLVVHYSFANNLSDSSGNGFNGISDTAIDFVPDRFSRINQAIRFNGPNHNSYFLLPALGNKQVDSVYSVSFWFTYTTVNSSNLFYKADKNEGAESAHTILVNNGRLRVIVGDGINHTKEFDGANTLPANTWTHVVLTTNGSQRINVYVNGREVYNTLLLSFHDENFKRIAFKSNAATAQGLLGGLSPFPLTNGKMDDFRLYNRTLTATEVMMLYQWTP